VNRRRVGRGKDNDGEDDDDIVVTTHLRAENAVFGAVGLGRMILVAEPARPGNADAFGADPGLRSGDMQSLKEDQTRQEGGNHAAAPKPVAERVSFRGCRFLSTCNEASASIEIKHGKREFVDILRLPQKNDISNQHFTMT